MFVSLPSNVYQLGNKLDGLLTSKDTDQVQCLVNSQTTGNRAKQFNWT